MGVPAFFRWLTMRYPKVVVDALTEADIELLQFEFDLKKKTGEVSLADKISAQNPQIDNLYLDMNGIIHPCAHPINGDPQPTSEFEIFQNIYQYTDKVIRLVNPQKLIYFAIDGVAPRAKMNQQRARRFRAAKDVEDDADRRAQIKAEKKDNVNYEDEQPTIGADFKFDSNVITPGTEFMHRLSTALKTYIVQRQNNEANWQNLTIIFSDASVPGEGEHKILDFIRSQRAQPGYNPNKRHCIYGADADLIMLGLSTHELHFFVLRECVQQIKDQYCNKCKQRGHMTYECGADYTLDKQRLARAVEFQYIKIAVVREYLALEFIAVETPFKFEFERVVDDFVFLCFLVGNDFLPHLPSLQIREGALDAILVIYKNLLPSLDGYLTNQGKINFQNTDVLFRDLAKLEEEHFKVLHIKLQKQKQRDEMAMKKDQPKQQDPEQPVKIESKVKQLAEQQHQEQVNSYVDKVQLGVDGWKMRYYHAKFLVTDPNDVEEFKIKIKQSYIEGLQWVFAYYYKGCESWDWYYPYHYAPFASDLINCDRVKINFDLGEPRRPFEQLMCVFPKQSAHALPKCYHWLMSSSQSPIIDFYPTNFKLDINGAAYAWMGVNLLPFIDTKRMQLAMKAADGDMKKLSVAEKQRNKKTGDIQLYFVAGTKSRLQRQLLQEGQVYRSNFESKDEVVGEVTGNPSGIVKLGEPIYVSERGQVVTLVEKNRVVVCSFRHPEYKSHLCRIQKGAIQPVQEVEDFEIYHVDRKFFNGETAIKMAEQVLNIDAKLDSVYYKTKLGKRTTEVPVQQLQEAVVSHKDKPEFMSTQLGVLNSYASKYYNNQAQSLVSDAQFKPVSYNLHRR